MRDYIQNITLLQKRINDLQTENQMLKDILEKNGIHYKEEIKCEFFADRTEAFGEDQGARIIHPSEITEKMANIFFSRFWGRQDVYAKRYENKHTGKIGYFTQCENFWKRALLLIPFKRKTQRYQTHRPQAVGSSSAGVFQWSA